MWRREPAVSLVSLCHPVHPEIKKMREIWNISFFSFKRNRAVRSRVFASTVTVRGYFSVPLLFLFLLCAVPHSGPAAGGCFHGCFVLLL